jgi:tRNA pseudouridine32 synthase/23S rRNA pseudouridine746 synthase
MPRPDPGPAMAAAPPAPLPTRDGVGPSCIALPVQAPQAGPTITDFLAHRFPAIARDEWLARMRQGEVVDAQGLRIAPGDAYRPGIKLYYYRSLPAEPRIPFEAAVLYRDAHLLVVDKPHFLPVTPAGRYLQETLLVRLRRQLGIDTLAPVHRIDRETAGLVLFSLQPATRALYHALFRRHAVAKQYEAIAPWRADLALPLVLRSRIAQGASFMQMREAAAAEGPPNAETTVALLERRGALARYRLQPVTGQRHQLRVQMAALGLPILNDGIYPRHLPEPPTGSAPDYSRPLQLLARSLAFTDPVSGRPLYLESRRSLQFPGS